jgi:hypothetical protein
VDPNIVIILHPIIFSYTVVLRATYDTIQFLGLPLLDVINRKFEQHSPRHKLQIISLMHRGTHRYTHSNPPHDLDLLSGQVFKTSALKAVVAGSNPARAACTFFTVLITPSKGKPKT